MCLVWLIASVIFLGMELLTASFFMIFFSCSALITCIISLFTDNILIQAIIFAVLSAIMIPIGKPLLKKFFNIDKHKPSTIDAMINRKGVVIKTITAAQYGLVKIDGEVWTAKSADGVHIEKGQRVMIREIDGVKAVVEPVE